MDKTKGFSGKPSLSGIVFGIDAIAKLIKISNIFDNYYHITGKFINMF